MEWNADTIAGLAILIASLAAIYARRAWKAAKRANELALHVYKKKIFDAFCELKMHMDQYGKSASMEAVRRFYSPSRDASIYFKNDLPKHILEYYGLCLDIADLAGRALSPEEQNNVTADLARSRPLAEKIDCALKESIGEITKNG